MMFTIDYDTQKRTVRPSFYAFLLFVSLFVSMTAFGAVAALNDGKIQDFYAWLAFASAIGGAISGLVCIVLRSEE